jgi:erythromycin esterase
MRVDGPGLTLAFDNMMDRPILGTGDWTQVSVVLDIASNAIGLSFGALLAGSGDLVMDDFSFEPVGLDVPTTDQLTTPVPSGADSATMVSRYASRPSAPANLDFEGLAGPAPETVAWLVHTALPIVTVQPGSDFADLQPFKQMVGAARVVGLGEGTHGTSEFFVMKHRIVEFLVRELGFTRFAIEASWPEANDMNRYVLGAADDPRRLLSNLYFWTWNTQEVLDMIEWMRQWNLSAPLERQVQFLGFDMQFPGAAMDAVAAFVSRASPADTALLRQRYLCLAPYRNVGATFGQPLTDYAGLPDSAKAACHRGLQEVYDLVLATPVDSQFFTPAYHTNALHSARVVQQWEDMAAQSLTYAGQLLRDRYMAENIGWLLGQAPPGTRMALWAHNGHVSRASGLMGWYLDSAYRADYVNLGFLFGRGGFNAIDMTGGTYTGVVKPFYADSVPNGSLEAAFMASGYARLLLDARLVPAGGDSARALKGPITMRSIGAMFDPLREKYYFASQFLPAYFDLLVYLRDTNPTTLLRFVRSPIQASPPGPPEGPGTARNLYPPRSR